MHPSRAALVRILPRSVVPPKSTLIPKPTPAVTNLKAAPSLIRDMVARQEKAGDTWPANLRIETFEDSREAYVGIKRDVIKGLRKVIHEK